MRMNDIKGSECERTYTQPVNIKRRKFLVFIHEHNIEEINE